MADVEQIVVTQFNGLDVRPRHSLGSQRRPLDTPRVLTNVQVDEYGHLHYPPASAELVHTFGDEIQTLRFINSPRGMLVQLYDGRIYIVPIPNVSYNLGSPTPVLLATAAEPGFPIWSASAAGFSFFGYAVRGEAGDGQTWTVASNGSGGYTVSNITASEPHSGELSYVEFYKGRRFCVSRGRLVRFSELNNFTSFPADNEFTIGGDDQGVNYATFPGAVQGMAAWEDLLLFFCENSVWILTGDSPENFTFRQAMTNIGNAQGYSLARVDDGIMYYGGRNLADFGVYLFSGNTSNKVSEQVDPLMRTVPGLEIFSTQAYGQYILLKPQASVSALQAYLYDFARRNWSTFDGWRRCNAEISSVGLFLNDNSSLYLNPVLSTWVFPRAPGRAGRITLGWDDDGNTAGLKRIMGVKIAGRKVGTGTPTIQVTARVPGGHAVSSPAVALTTDVFDNVVVPVNLRGHGVELDITITPTHNSDGVTIESLQLIHSRKGEKLDRG